MNSNSLQSLRHIAPLLFTLSSPAFAQVDEPSEQSPAPATPDAQPEPSAGAPGVGRPGVSTPHPPLDFCVHRPRGGGQEYEAQRIVLLNALVSENTDPERELGPNGELVGTHGVFARVRAGELARRVVMLGLPLPRFLMAFSRQPATAALFTQQQLSLAQVRAAAGEDDFVAYSLGCSDWLMVPRIERGAATWSRVEKEKTVIVNNETKKVKYMAWIVNAPWTIEVRVFKRSGSGFELATTFDGTPGGLAQAAAAIAQTGGEDVAFHSYASTWPAPGCTIGEPVDGQPGSLGGCSAVEPELTFELPAIAPGAACGSDDSVAGGTAAMESVARCNALESSRRAVNLLNVAEKRFWAIHAALAQRGGDWVIASGNSNGVHRGDYYVAREGQQQLGFARVTQVGAGGREAPSVLKFKSGGAPIGTQMYEHALMGVQFGLRPSTAMLVSHGDLSSRLAFGGGATIGYDLTRRLAWLDEVWARINVGYLYASSQERLLTFDAGLDATTYFGSGVAGVIGLGLSVWLPQIERMDASMTKALEYSGTSTGGVARVGLEYAFGPDWCVTVGADGRTGFSKAELKNDASFIKYDAGSLLAASGHVGLAHTF